MAHMVAPLEVGVCCSNLDRVVPFYIELLEATMIATNEVAAEKAGEAAVGACGFRVTRIELPTGERLKFLQPDVAPAVAPRPATILEQRNTSYLTFIVDDLAVVAGRLKAKGAKILTGAEPVEIRPGVSILLAHDPEQNIIEFVCYADISAYRPELG